MQETNFRFIFVVIIAALLALWAISYYVFIPSGSPYFFPLIKKNPPMPNILLEMQSAAGISFGKPALGEFAWNARQAGEANAIMVKGFSIGAEDVSEESYAKTEQFLVEKGFEQDFYNVADSASGGIKGYRKDGTFCLLIAVYDPDMESPEASPRLSGFGLSCAESDKIPSYEILDEEVIKELIAEEYDTEPSSITIAVTNKTENYIRGNLKVLGETEPAPEEAAPFLAAKKDGAWELVFDGRGIIVCDKMEEYGFPEEMTKDCQDIEPGPGMTMLREEVENYLTKGNLFSVYLEANPSTGYGWEPEFPAGYIQLVDEKYEETPHEQEIVGVGGVSTFTFLALDSGKVEIKFYYLRVWEGKGSAAETKIYKLTISQY